MRSCLVSPVVGVAVVCWQRSRRVASVLAAALACLAAAATATGEERVFSESGPVTFYELWRSETNNPATASAFKNASGNWSRWLLAPSFFDDTAEISKPYYYWTRAVTANTRTIDFSGLGFANDSFSGSMSLTVPLMAKEGTTLPVRIAADITDNNWGGPPTRVWDVYYHIGEYDYDFDGHFLDTSAGWTSSPPNDPRHTREFTEYCDIVGVEKSFPQLTDWHSPAEVYGSIKVKGKELIPLTHMSVSLLDGDHYQPVPFVTSLDAAPTGLTASKGLTTGVQVNWDPAVGQVTEFTADAVMGVRDAGGLNWVRNPANGHYYALTSTFADWATCEAEAESFGGTLAIVNDGPENAWLTEFVRDSYSRDYPGNSVLNLAWIGYMQTAEGWEWVNGDPVTYTSLFSEWGTRGGVHAYIHGANHFAPGTWFSDPLEDQLYGWQPRGVIEITPEPATLALLAIGGAGLIGGAARRRR